ncbi:S-methyl-5'-thioadenosine phosphorylase [Amphiplicatus metriothermophilus]|uniref:S-methyl-5'-thioadenosine phosphorylase n=1 Tax=Amphiplicatus metriothermophilus TaxID=1519374 RepID=A0A239PM46_9PROT|nr:S-methyl-5'-thioadenosine phosphorylase [Amphiplicatus metriothermophilus]MBB5517221.1 5'-methylthioadenosine phosphorylase [Amphiplicatus metriothermophilus]SNT68443.1 methylthioadenosine phosphorylase [Amphiplicatus metriothermophilus]
MTERVLGVIGGSGVYAIEDLDDVERLDFDTPWGAPSDALVRGRLNGVRVIFLARHGVGHRLTPGAINYRANIDALKRAGASDVVSLSACGSLREDLPPGTFVLVDQFVDRTSGREKSFFGPGFVAHVSLAEPVCPGLRGALAQACRAVGVPFADRGTYVCIDGPQFSTRAESRLYRAWGCDVIGMTNMPEVRLAREAELPYASVAMVTDYDCWRETDKAVEVGDVLAVLKANAAAARRLLDRLTRDLGPVRTPSPLGIETVLDHAVITPPEARSPEMIAKLDAVAGRILRGGA